MQNDKIFFDPNFKAQVTEAPKLEAIRKEDLSLTDYHLEHGGPFGRLTYATLHHATLGSKPFQSMLPMSEEAILEWIVATTSSQAYARMPEAGGGIHEVPQEKPEGLWVGDPAEGAKQALAAKRAQEGE